MDLNQIPKMKIIITFCSLMLFSIFFNVFTLSLIDDYQQLIDRLPSIAYNGFINGCLTSKTGNKIEYIGYCTKEAKDYLDKLNKALEKVDSQ